MVLQDFALISMKLEMYGSESQQEQSTQSTTLTDPSSPRAFKRPTTKSAQNQSIFLVSLALRLSPVNK